MLLGIKATSPSVVHVQPRTIDVCATAVAAGGELSPEPLTNKNGFR